MINGGQIMIWDATPTWSGFLYQGKVAIFHLLKTINESLKNSDICPQSECSNYAMEIEWIEDFSIKDKANVNKYYTLHQVKAYKSQEASAYANAIAKIEENINRCSLNGIIPKGYLHVIQQLEINCKNPNIFIYQYKIEDADKSHCGLDEIEKIIKVEIEKLCNERTLTGEEVDEIYLLLMNEVDRIVRERHKNIQEDGREKARVEQYIFCKICELIKERSTRKGVHFENILKRQFMKTFEKFCLKILEDYETLSKSGIKIAVSKEKMPDYYKYINKVWSYYNDKRSFKYFCQMVTPDYTAKDVLDEEDLRKLIPDSSLKEFYFPTTENLVKHGIGFEDNGIFRIRERKYLVTNITRQVDNLFYNDEVNKELRKIEIERLKEDILCNPSNIETLFEIDTLISKEIDADKLYNRNFTKIPDLDCMAEYEKIVHIKENIEIISKNTLKERIGKCIP